MPDLLRYLKMKKSGIIAQKRLDNISFPSMYCERDQEQEFEEDGGSQCKYQCK